MQHAYLIFVVSLVTAVYLGGCFVMSNRLVKSKSDRVAVYVELIRIFDDVLGWASIAGVSVVSLVFGADTLELGVTWLWYFASISQAVTLIVIYGLVRTLKIVPT